MRMLFFTLACLSFISFSVKAQDPDFPTYGSPSRYETELKQCTFDKTADAVILLHEAVSNYDDDYHLVTIHHIRIKILTEKGIDEANVKISYWRKDDFENVYGIEAMTINVAANGQLIKQRVDNKSIYDQKETEHIGIKSFAFPSVKAGSIIEYRYTSQMKHYGGLDDWLFQDELPVVDSKYMLYVVPNAEFAYRVSKREDIPVTITPGEGKIFFEMQNIPGLNHEPYMDARADYLQKVIFQLSGYNNRDNGKEKYMNSWDDVIKKLMLDEDFGSQINKKISGSAELLTQIATMSPERKMRAVYNFVRKNMEWNHINSKYAIDGVKSAWQKRKGTSGEINLVLINVLKDAGLEVYPALVSERWHGKVNTDYPFIDQFNTVLACVVIDHKKYFLDATDQVTPAHIIPYNLLNTTALIVDRKNGGLVNISNESLQYEEDIHTTIDLKEDGSYSGKVIVKSNDYARVMRVMEYKDDKDEFMEEYFHKGGDVLSVKEFQILNLENDSLPLEQHAEFISKRGAADGYAYIPLNLFSGFEKNPFLSDERFSNINFGYRRTINIVTAVTIPQNYIVDALPGATKIITAGKDISITRQVDHDKGSNLVYCTILIEFKNGLYTADAYPVLKKLYDKMFNLLKEPVVLKKK